MAMVLNDLGRQVPPTDFSLIPEVTLMELRRYVNRGVYWEMGDFMEAIIRGDFYKAIKFADEANQIAIVAIATWCYNHMPGNAWGSEEAVTYWKKVAWDIKETAANNPEAIQTEPQVLPVEQDERVPESDESLNLSNDIMKELGWENEDE